jgi:hypothetical protein
MCGIKSMNDGGRADTSPMGLTGRCVVPGVARSSQPRAVGWSPLGAVRCDVDPRGRRRLRRRLHVLESEYRQCRIDETALQMRADALFAHARFADDLGWRRTVTGFTRIDDDFGEVQETGQPCSARRLLEQFRQELPLRVSQQEQGRQPQQEQRLSGLFVSRHGDAEKEKEEIPPDVAPSRVADTHVSGNKTTRKAPPAADIQPGVRPEKAADGAADGKEGSV